MKRACLAAILLAACNSANADLADLEDLTVRVSAGPSLADGAEHMHITLEYGGIAKSVPHGCAVLGYVHVEVNGHLFDDLYPGEWRDTSLAGSTPYCNEPEYSITRGQLTEGDSATVELDDGSRTIVIEMPRLRAARTIAPDQTTLEPGAQVGLSTSLAAGDQLATGRATANLDDGQCSKWPLLDVNLDPESGYSFEVPDWIDLQDNQNYVFSCDSPLVAGQPRQATLDLSVAVVPELRCEGADRCDVTWTTGQTTAATIIP